ncbi:MAG: DUF433 domain-containing protein [Armatimonadetes bacterium]|nr:DUF433 domain-containing protein [Armatimonadota bacterium]
MRIPASLVVNLVAHGMSPREIIADHPDLEPEDTQQCLEHAAWLARDRVYA